MRIVCPACAAAYEVPDERVKPGRRTRCTRCETTWTPVDEPPESVAEPADRSAAFLPGAPFESQPLDRLVGAAPPPVAPARSGVWMGWLATVVVLAGLGWAGYNFRTTVMQNWPPSTRVYAALGLYH